MAIAVEEIIDLRSDTVTRPDAGMRKAMAEAEVGDDVYQEDPTVKELEKRAAKLLDKEAALFFPSGTMANQAAVLTHTTPGEEVILGADSHIFYYEVAGLAKLSGVQARILPDEEGCPEPEDIREAIRGDNIHFPVTGLLCLENTHNRSGGLPVAKNRLRACCEVAREKGIPVHLDGARIFNASLALDVPPAELVKDCDSIMFCLSKGLGAPMGSLLTGSKDFIERARKNRKLLGGGLRQVGVIAAAGLVALENREELQKDHQLAVKLAEIIRDFPDEDLGLANQATNFVMLEYTGSKGAGWLEQKLAEVGVLCNKLHDSKLRLLTHRDLEEKHIDQFAERLDNIFSRGGE